MNKTDNKLIPNNLLNLSSKQKRKKEGKLGLKSELKHRNVNGFNVSKKDVFDGFLGKK
jgi:hypothetical protein